MPWNNRNSVNNQEIFNAREAILEYAKNIDSQAFRDAKVLIDRRMIFALRSKSNLKTKLQMMKLGKAQVLPICCDLLKL
jgi:hypothetical protein